MGSDTDQPTLKLSPRLWIRLIIVAVAVVGLIIEAASNSQTTTPTGPTPTMPPAFATINASIISPTPSPTLTTTPIPTRPPNVAPCFCNTDMYNCDFFSTQQRAQDCLDYCQSKGLGDIHHLDPDEDGTACNQ